MQIAAPAVRCAVFAGLFSLAAVGAHAGFMTVVNNEPVRAIAKLADPTIRLAKSNEYWARLCNGHCALQRVKTQNHNSPTSKSVTNDVSTAIAASMALLKTPVRKVKGDLDENSVL